MQKYNPFPGVITVGKRKIAACSHAIALLAAIAFTPAHAILINFDDVASGTNINTQYSGLGVTLGCFNGNNASFNTCTGNAFALATVLANSAPNVISLTATGFGNLVDERFGFFSASFASPVASVSIDARAILPLEYLGTTTNRPFLQAFDATGMFLGQALYSGSVYTEAWETLTFSRAAADIKFVAFSSFNSSGHPVYGTFDNLNYSSVPVPAAVWLFGSGLMGLVGIARRNRKTMH